jgi:hypothetical protein
VSTAAPPPPGPAPTPSAARPAAYLVRLQDVKPAVFLDKARATDYAARYGGQVVALYEHP